MAPFRERDAGAGALNFWNAANDPYLKLPRQNMTDARARLLACSLKSNHVHLIARAGREDSLAVLMWRAHGRYAQYYNARTGGSGHQWQNRYFACLPGRDHLWGALAYVERNPVRAGLAVRAPSGMRSPGAGDKDGSLSKEKGEMDDIRLASSASRPDPRTKKVRPG